jgi:hypothetical protein
VIVHIIADYGHGDLAFAEGAFPPRRQRVGRVPAAAGRREIGIR